MGQLEVQSSFAKQRRRWGVVLKYILKRVDLSGFVQFPVAGWCQNGKKPGHFLAVCLCVILPWGLCCVKVMFTVQKVTVNLLLCLSITLSRRLGKLKHFC